MLKTYKELEIELVLFKQEDIFMGSEEMTVEDVWTDLGGMF